MLGEGWTLEFLCERGVGVSTCFVFANNLHVVSAGPHEFLTAALHEPYLEVYVSRERVKQGLALAFPVVGSKNRLLELFLVSVGHGQIDCLEISTAAVVDEYEPAGGQNQFALAFEFSHARDVKLKVYAVAVKNKMLVLDPKRISLCILRRIESHF